MASQALPSFTYDDLPDNSSFRVIKTIELSESVVRCSLHTVSLRSPPSYTALSYTWGSADPNDSMTADLNRTIICNECALAVTENLWTALRTIHSGKGFLWADAVCINQRNLEERSSQVAKMGEIYSKAYQVIVWLGPADGAAVVAFRILEDFIPRLAMLAHEEGAKALQYNSDDSTFWAKVGREKFTDYEANALTYLFNRYWFDRAWVIQEVIFAKKVIVLCGPLNLEWNYFTIMSQYLFNSGCSRKWQHLRVEALGDDYVRPIGVAPMSMDALKDDCEDGIPIGGGKKLPPVSEIPKDDIERAFSLFLEYLIHATRLYQATMPHDKVFAPAAAALYQFSSAVRPGFLVLDYTKSVAEVYTEIGRLILSHNSRLSLLSWVEDRSFRKYFDLPSWVPDFSVITTGPLIALEGSGFDCMNGANTTCEVSANGREFKAKGFFLDSISAIGPYHDDTTALSINPTRWLEFALTLGDTYVTEETSISAFIRTLIADQRGDFDIPALSNIFHAFLLYTCARSRDMNEIQHELTLQPNKTPSWPVLDAFESQKTAAVPTFSTLMKWIESVRKGNPDDRELVDFSRHFIGHAHLSALMGRRLLKFSKGYIGLMPVSAREGDEIWFMPGSKVPFVLRKTSEGGVYEFFGEAYVHGFMYGEYWENARPEFEWITVK